MKKKLDEPWFLFYDKISCSSFPIITNSRAVQEYNSLLNFANLLVEIIEANSPELMKEIFEKIKIVANDV